MRSMIWSAVLVHLNGRAVSFQVLIHSSSAVLSAPSEQKVPRSRQRRSSSANHRSTWLIHDEYVGVKCSPNRGCASSHLCTAGALCAERLSHYADIQSGAVPSPSPTGGEGVLGGSACLSRMRSLVAVRYGA
jgi:hypothetical protein